MCCTIQHRTVVIIFALIFWTITIAQLLSGGYIVKLNTSTRKLSDWQISPHADDRHTWLYGCPMHYRFITLWPWALTPGSKFTKLGGGLQQAPLCHPANFSPIAHMVYKMSVNKIFHFLGLEANHCSKFTQLPTRVYHPAKNSSACVNPLCRYPLQKICRQKQLQTSSKRHKSRARLSACDMRDVNPPQTVWICECKRPSKHGIPGAESSDE